MAHPLVDQLRFARSEFWRGLEGFTEEDACRRVPPMNCSSWNVGHLAWQEQRYWLRYGAGRSPLPFPEIDAAFRSGGPASTPPLSEVRHAWEAVTAATDPWLDALDGRALLAPVVREGKPTDILFGLLLLRMTDHYWYHTGENAAIRRCLGHTGLPDFVGNIDAAAPYRPE